MSLQQKEIEEAIEVIDKIAENTERLITDEIEKTLLNEFLETLCHKVEQINQAKVVSYNSTKNFINFCCEIPKIDPADTKTPHQVIRTIDDVNIDYFFKKETTLHVFNFCSKYFMFPQFCTKREVNVISFNWSRNKFDENKICYCFMCKFNLDLSKEQKDKERKQELENKNDN